MDKARSSFGEGNRLPDREIVAVYEMGDFKIME